jgi:hypothetical protein
MLVDAILKTFARIGADEWSRTTDLLITNQLLYQLSYISTEGESSRDYSAGRWRSSLGPRKNNLPIYARRIWARCVVASRLCGSATPRASRLASHPKPSAKCVGYSCAGP